MVRPRIGQRRIRVLAFWTAFVGLFLLVISHLLKKEVELKEHPFWATVVDALADLAHEVGFAAVVAVVIWLVFEYFTRDEAEREWKSRVEEITKNVFYGVLRRSLPPALIREADALVLNQTFLRLNLRVDYSFKDAVTEGPRRIEFVELTATLRYTIRNMGEESAAFPIRVAVPNPQFPELQRFCDVTDLWIQPAGEARTKQDITVARAKFQAARDGGGWTAAHLEFTFGEHLLAPGAEIEIDLTYVMAKECEDQELFETLYPSDSITIYIVDASMRRTIGAGAHHPGELQDLTPEHVGPTYQYRLNRYLLPHQGVSVWWKLRPHENGTAGEARTLQVRD